MKSLTFKHHISKFHIKSLTFKHNFKNFNCGHHPDAYKIKIIEKSLSFKQHCKIFEWYLLAFKHKQFKNFNFESQMLTWKIFWLLVKDRCIKQDQNQWKSNRILVPFQEFQFWSMLCLRWKPNHQPQEQKLPHIYKLKAWQPNQPIATSF